MALVSRQKYQTPAPAHGDLERETIELNTATGSNFSYDGGIKMAQFHIPRTTNKFLDGKSSYLRFNISASAGTGVRHDYNAYAFIRKIKVHSNGVDLSVLDEEALRQVMLHKLLPDDYVTSQGVPEGHGSVAERKSMVSNNMYFCLPLSHWAPFNAESYLPCPFFGQGGTAFTVEVHFAPAVEALVLDSTGAESYTVSNVKMMLDYVRQPQEYLQAVAARMNAGQPLTIYCESWAHGSENLANSGEQVLRFGVSRSSAKAALFVFRKQSNISSDTERSLSEWTFPEGLSEVQMRIGDTLVPQSKMDCSKGAAIPYTELMKAVGQYNSFLAGNQLREYNPISGDGSDFLIGLQLEGHSHGALADRVLSGIDLKSKNSPIELIVNSSNSENLRVDMYVQHDMLIILTPDGISVVS